MPRHTPKGWYPDPQRPGYLKWWTGSTWGLGTKLDDQRTWINRPASSNFAAPGRGWVKILVGLAAFGALASFMSLSPGDGGQSCEDAYRTEYVFYGEPGSMTQEQYCENVGDFDPARYGLE